MRSSRPSPNPNPKHHAGVRAQDQCARHHRAEAAELRLRRHRVGVLHREGKCDLRLYAWLSSESGQCTVRVELYRMKIYHPVPRTLGPAMRICSRSWCWCCRNLKKSPAALRARPRARAARGRRGARRRPASAPRALGAASFPDPPVCGRACGVCCVQSGVECRLCRERVRERAEKSAWLRG